MDRPLNILRWFILIIETVICVFLPYDIYFPNSIKYMINVKKLGKLKNCEKKKITDHFVYIGIASILTVGAFAFGSFGKYSPNDLFQDGRLETEILNIRRKNNCSICLETFKYKDELTVLDCKHCFHTSCINSWKQTCPLCRTSF